MNRMILDGFARLGGGRTVDTSESRNRLDAAMADIDAAWESGDDTAIHVAESHLDKLVEEARAGRQGEGSEESQPGESQPDESTPADLDVSFDGGVRGGRRRPTPGLTPPPTPAQLISQAIFQHRSEREPFVDKRAIGYELIGN